jgi:hypothetical protein
MIWIDPPPKQVQTRVKQDLLAERAVNNASLLSMNKQYAAIYRALPEPAELKDCAVSFGAVSVRDRPFKGSKYFSGLSIAFVFKCRMETS